MCGVFGWVSRKQDNIDFNKSKLLIDNLFTLSESRGKESSGLSLKLLNDNKIIVLKKSIPASKLIKSNDYNKIINTLLYNTKSQKLNTPFYLIAHARLVTNGTQDNNNNNQPIIKDNCVAVHNGIITNVDELWSKYQTELSKRIYEVDTEVFISLLRKYINKHKEIYEALKKTFNEIEGTVSIALQFQDIDTAILATNNGSLYYVLDAEKDNVLFASEKFILKESISKSNANKLFPIDKINRLNPGECLIFQMSGDKKYIIDNFRTSEKKFNLQLHSIKNEIENLNPDKPIDFHKVETTFLSLKNSPLRNLLQYNVEAIKQLKRCKKCVLPETFPFIEFDEEGVCNYCKYYIPRKMGSKKQEFLEILDKYRSKEGKPDCLVPFSGGRDSSFGLHYIVNELKMHPITYTYDWGMVTDLARRNIARLCGKLGIENIIVSADIHQKRKNIRLNVEAWLKNPQLGLVPLFMAGDKQFFYYVNKVKKQTGIPLDIWCTNYLENTDFKVGFCGVRPTFDKHRPDYLPLSSKIKMALYYIRHFLINPAYINSSIWDTIFSFYAYYAEPRIHFYQLYDWIKWDEDEITNTLLKEYNWELSPDTTSTWRIGDGTSAFYNYIYYTVAGFSEIETFRSNQIREGLISREEAMSKIFEENKPRFESLKWYLDTIQVDFAAAIKIINNIPKLYRV